MLREAPATAASAAQQHDNSNSNINRKGLACSELLAAGNVLAVDVAVAVFALLPLMMLVLRLCSGTGTPVDD